MTPTHGPNLLRHIRRVAAAQCPSRRSDRELVQQFIAEHDEAAFAALVERHASMVLGVCRHVLHHQQDAEDVFQAVFLVLARKAHTIRQQQALSSWLHGVAYRLALKARTRRSRRQQREQPSAEPIAAGTVDDLTVRELGMLLHAELERLPDAYRSPLLLCYWEGKTRDEAAAQLGMTAGAFKKRLERARRLLGGRLTRRGLVLSAALWGMATSATAATGTIAPGLLQTTAHAAVAYAVGQPAGAATAALALAEGAIRAMNLTRWTTTVLTVAFLAGVTVALALAGYRALGELHAGAPIQAAAPALQPPGKDKAKPAKKADAQRIVGIWRVTKGVAGGKDLPVELTTLARMHFTKDGQAILHIAEKKSEGKYKLAGPGKIDLTIRPDEALGHAIYKFDGDDRLTICGPKENTGERPTEFTSDQDNGNVLLTLTRAKPGEEKPTPDEIAKFAAPAAQVQEATARTLSAKHLKEVGAAMLSYEEAHKALPSAAVCSKDGKTPLLSWRVAILPYLDQQALYKAFKLDEPWDSPHNKKLIAKMPEVYGISIGVQGKGLTYYQVITGPGTLFDGKHKVALKDLGTRTAEALLVVEATDPVIWTKPADLTLPKEKDKMPAVGGLFKNGFHVLLANGTVHQMARTAPPALLRSLATPKRGDE